MFEYVRMHITAVWFSNCCYFNYTCNIFDIINQYILILFHIFRILFTSRTVFHFSYIHFIHVRIVATFNKTCNMYKRKNQYIVKEFLFFKNIYHQVELVITVSFMYFICARYCALYVSSYIYLLTHSNTKRPFTCRG